MRSFRSIMTRVRSISPVLAFILSGACSTETTQQGPVAPEPAQSGDFELTVEVTGTRPDADGYDVSIALATEVDPLRISVEPSGGMLRLSELPAGTHVLRMQGLAFYCRVTGTHPVSFTIHPGITTKVKVSISCPGPGAPPAPSGTLELRVTGHDAVVLGGFRVVILVSGETEPLIRIAPPHARTLIPALPPGTHSLRVEPRASNCVVGDAGGHPFTIVAGEIKTIELAASCSPIFGSFAGSYEREIPDGETPWFLSERFVLQADGSFRLRYESSGTGAFEYSGAFFQESDSANTRLQLLFTGSPAWSAVATLEAGCLEVEYNLDMVFSDFVSGRYCK